MSGAFWHGLGTVEHSGMPAHMPIGVTEHGEGPVIGNPPAHHWECWCRDVDCPLTEALTHAWQAGRRVGMRKGSG